MNPDEMREIQRQGMEGRNGQSEDFARICPGNQDTAGRQHCWVQINSHTDKCALCGMEREAMVVRIEPDPIGEALRMANAAHWFQIITMFALGFAAVVAVTYLLATHKFM